MHFPQRTFEKSEDKAFFKVPFFLVAQNKTESGFFSSLSVKNKAEKILDSQQFLFCFFAVEKTRASKKEEKRSAGQEGNHGGKAVVCRGKTGLPTL